MEKMKDVPFSVRKGDFYSRIAQASRYSALSEEEQEEYDRYLKYENDRLLELQWTLAEGEAKGRAEGIAEGEAKGRAEGEAKGRAEGRAEGIAEGEAENQMEVAKKMIEMGLDLSLISEITGLSIDSLKKINPTQAK